MEHHPNQPTGTIFIYVSFGVPNPANKVRSVLTIYRVTGQDVAQEMRETKQQPCRARSGSEISCCLVPSILSGHPVLCPVCTPAAYSSVMKTHVEERIYP